MVSTRFPPLFSPTFPQRNWAKNVVFRQKAPPFCAWCGNKQAPKTEQEHPGGRTKVQL